MNTNKIQDRKPLLVSDKLEATTSMDKIELTNFDGYPPLEQITSKRYGLNKLKQHSIEVLALGLRHSFHSDRCCTIFDFFCINSIIVSMFKQQNPVQIPLLAESRDTLCTQPLAPTIQNQQRSYSVNEEYFPK